MLLSVRSKTWPVSWQQEQAGAGIVIIRPPLLCSLADCCLFSAVSPVSAARTTRSEHRNKTKMCAPFAVQDSDTGGWVYRAEFTTV